MAEVSWFLSCNCVTCVLFFHSFFVSPVFLILSSHIGSHVMSTPATKAEKKDESVHVQWWYPSRCEHSGCEVLDGLGKCSACKMVQYCCKEHQKADWPAHKDECKCFQRIGARATFYVDAEILERFPMRPPDADATGQRAVFSLSHEPIPSPTSCPLCLRPSSSQEVKMMRTGCCGQVLCDDPETFSCSRDFCSRSHDRYTLCGFHGVGDGCDTTKDWRECPKCQSDSRPAAEGCSDRLWRGLNPYNFYPLLSSSVQRHGICATCNLCRKKFLPGMEGCCHHHTHGLICNSCYR